MKNVGADKRPTASEQCSECAVCLPPAITTEMLLPSLANALVHLNETHASVADSMCHRCRDGLSDPRDVQHKLRAAAAAAAV